MRIRVMLLALCLSAGALLAKPEAPASALTLSPTKDESQAVIWAARFLTKWHYKRVALDDAMSSEILEHYLDSLDSERLIFLQPDVDAFAKFREHLDDSIYEGDIDPPFEIFERYRQRLAERTAHARGLLKGGFEFTAKENLVTDREHAPYARSVAELDDLWRRRVKNDLLRLKLAGKNDKEIVTTLDKRYKNLEGRIRELSGDDVFQSFVNAYASAIEPHTNYLAPRTAENFNIQMRLSLEGIGAVLNRDEEYTAVRTIVKGGPADKQGQLKVGDRIVSVAQGAGGGFTDVIGWRLDDVVDLIRGNKGTTVRLEVIPAEAGSDTKPSEIAIVREKVKLEEQAAKKRVIEAASEGGTRRIGVIELQTFYHDFEGQRRGDPDYRSTTRDVARLLKELKAEKVEGVVVDLRDNGGGSLAEATQLTGLFIDQGPVVQVRDAQGSVTVEEDREPGVVWDGPLAILVNRGSASASEIFAAALQDYGRALIVGENTFGKGTVQNLVDLDQMARNDKPRYGQLKMTIAQFFRVNGGSTQHKGVLPDVAFPATWDPKDFGESALENALPWTSIAAAKYVSRGDLAPLIPALSTRYQERMAKDREFQWYLEDLADYRKTREQKEVSLLEADRRAERDRQDKRRATREAARKALGEDTERRDEPKADTGLEPGETPATDTRDTDQAQGKPDLLLSESSRVLADAISLLQGNRELAQRVKAFALTDVKPVN